MKPSLYRRYRRKYLRGATYQGDAIEFLLSRRDASADLVFLDPPFNLGKKYNDSRKLDSISDEIYKERLELAIKESTRILKTCGALYLYHLPKWAIHFGNYLKQYLDFRHWIAVSMKNGFARGNRLYPAHYALLYYTKGEPTVFSRPKLQPNKCRHCGGFIKDYGGYRKIIEAKGINLSDFWDDLSPVRHSSTKNREQNELPLAFMERIFAISGVPGGTYIDPFVGGGAGLLEAAKAHMQFQGCDIVPANLAICQKRLSEYLSQLDQGRTYG